MELCTKNKIFDIRDAPRQSIHSVLAYFYTFLSIKNLYFSSIAITFISCDSNDKTSLDILGRNENSLSYNVAVSEKFFFENDTIRQDFKVHIRKNENDSLYGYDFKISNPDSNLLYYNIENNLFAIDRHNKTYNKIDVYQSRLKEMIIPYLNLSEEDLYDSENTSIIKSKKGIKIIKNYNSDNEIKNVQAIFHLSSSPKNKIEYILTADFQNKRQYFRYQFSEIENRVSTIDIYDQFAKIEEEYTLNAVIIGESNTNKQDYKKIPNFTGVLLNQYGGGSIDFKSFDSKVIIVEYWYMACYPCIKMIPFLNEIYKKYSDYDIEIIGVNIIDNNPQKINPLKNFIEYHEMKNPVFLTDENQLNISSYPTIIILNQYRDIIYISSGYSKEKELEIIKVIEKEFM